MAFGISGDDTRTFMVGADVVVTWVGQDGVANAVDYYLNERQQVCHCVVFCVCVSVCVKTERECVCVCVCVYTTGIKA